MGSEPNIYCYEGNKPFTLLKWKTRVGSQLFYNSVILSYKLDGVTNNDAKDPLLKYKSNLGGTVVELLASEGDTIQQGDQLLKVQPCTHPVIMKDLCAECGQDLRHLDRDNFEKLTAAATFSMVHVVPELKVCLEQAEKLGQDDENRLLKSRKLVLLVDLDQTLIHTTNDNVIKDLPDVHHFQLYGMNSPWYHTKLRPGTKPFLKKISKYYELHICTFGARLYAHKIAQILDPHGELFSHRILSRDECFDATSKTGNLKALFPRGDDMVCIIDDREDVWNFAPNVVHVKPYCYFHNTGDINAPPFCVQALNAKENSDAAIALESNDSNQVKSKSSSKDELSKDMAKAEIDDKSDPENKLKNVEKVSSLKDSESKNEENEKSSENNTKSTDQIIVEASDHKDEVQSDEKNKTSNEIIGDQIKKSTIENDDALLCKAKESKPKSVELLENNTSKLTALNEFTASDDYLLYLEEILENIHKEFYKVYDKMKKEGKRSIPDLKVIVPKVRSKVLKGCNVVFSSIIPTNLHPETTRFWTLAESLGAHVSVDLVLDSSKNRTTHVVASKLGTAKVNAAKRHPDIYIVNIDWLFCCAERWERTDERLFPLTKDIAPPFIDGIRPFERKVENTFYDPTTGKSLKAWPGSKRSHSQMKKKSRKIKNEDEFSERIFVEAGLSLSKEDIDDMDREVEEACSGESEKESRSNSSSESSDESLSSGDYPKGWKKPRRDYSEVDLNSGEESSDAETIGSVNEEMAEAVRQEFGS